MKLLCNQSFLSPCCAVTAFTLLNAGTNPVTGLSRIVDSNFSHTSHAWIVPFG